MDLILRSPKAVSQSKERCRFQITQENLNPNVSNSSPGRNLVNPLRGSGTPNSKSTKSSSVQSVKTQKSASSKKQFEKQVAVSCSPRTEIRGRKFVVAKKKGMKDDGGQGVTCKCKHKHGGKCLCMAYETLRASQEEFFKPRDFREKEIEDEEMEKCFMPERNEDGEMDASPKMSDSPSPMKRRRDQLLEEARNSLPESGKVMHLVNAFEKLFSMSKSDARTDETKIPPKWALPGFNLQSDNSNQTHHPLSEQRISAFSFCSSDICLTSEKLGLDSRASTSSYSWDGSHCSISSRSSNGSRSRRNSSGSCGDAGGRRWKKKKKHLKPTSQKPFKLITEQRGKLKVEEFVRKIQEMMLEEERRRIPVAQGLPWTTDEPQCLSKPMIKENTIPIDLTLHSDIRAAERAEFDQHVALKLNMIERYKMERELQQKMEEEERIRRLRKELVPKAQPMPYFDRPFVPRRSLKHPTVPKQPCFHIPKHKKIKCCSWNDMSAYLYQPL